MYTTIQLYFRWRVLSTDVRWVRARRVTADWSIGAQEELVLAPTGYSLHWLEGEKEGSAYEPLESCTGVFQELAALEPTPDAIQRFATQYGPLTRGHLYIPTELDRQLFRLPKADRLAHPYDADWGRMSQAGKKQAVAWQLRGAVDGDSLAVWEETIHKLRSLVAIWDAARGKNDAILRARMTVAYADQTTTVSFLDENQRVVFGPHQIVDTKNNMPKLKLHEAAEWTLHAALAKHVNHCSSVSLHAPDSPNRHKLAIVPHSLRDAIWLQFALAVIEHKKFGACEVCGKPFEISPQVARTNRKLCSPACKAKAHRQRREKALGLAALGRTPKQISKQVGSQLSTVQKWLEAAKREA